MEGPCSLRALSRPWNGKPSAKPMSRCQGNRGFGFRVEGLGFKVLGLGFRV